MEEKICSELLGVYTVHPVPRNLELISETVRAEGKLLLSVESGDETGITSVSEKKWLLTGFNGSLRITVSSEVFDSGVSIVKYLKLISIRGFIGVQ